MLTARCPHFKPVKCCDIGQQASLTMIDVFCCNKIALLTSFTAVVSDLIAYFYLILKAILIKQFKLKN